MLVRKTTIRCFPTKYWWWIVLNKNHPSEEYWITSLGEKDKKVLIFLYEWGRPIRVGDMKKFLNLPHSTLNSICKRLEEKGFLSWDKYGLVSLQDPGRFFAAHALRHHVILENFFVMFLKLPPNQAHEDALNSITCLSCDAIKKMEQLVNRDDSAPCGATTTPFQQTNPN